MMAGSLPNSNFVWPYRSKKSGLKTGSGLLGGSMIASIAFVFCFLLETSHSIQFLGEKETFAKYQMWNSCNNASIRFGFKTTQPDGLLMFTNYHGKTNYLQVAIVEGAIQLRIHFVGRKEQNVELSVGSNMNDGTFHKIQVKRNRMETMLVVDGQHSSKVAFGSDFAEDGENTNFVYFGGIPNNYMQSQAQPPLPPTNAPFRGEMINIMYFNCSCIPVRPSFLEGQGVRTDVKEACEVRNPCPNDCPCVSSDGGATGCECQYKEECIKDLLAYYQLPMDSLNGDLIYNLYGLDSLVYGKPMLVPGVHENALKLDGRSQWIRVSGPAHKKECFGDLDHCPKGYFIGFWIQFLAATDYKAVYMSNGGNLASGHGVGMSYSRSGLEFVFKTKDGKEWKVAERNVLPGRWYHVAASWAADKGLFLYINGHQVAHEQASRRTQESKDGGPHKDFIIGRSNDHTDTNQLNPIIIDDFTFISEFKSESQMREEGPAFHYYLSLDSVQGNKVPAIGLAPRVYGQVQVVSAKVRQGVGFSGMGEYIDLGDASKSCLGDLSLCKHGLYMSFFIRFSRLGNDRGYIFSSPHGMDIYQNGNQLVATAQSDRNIWEARYEGLSSGTWYFIEVSWSQGEGISLYVNDKEVSTQIRESSVRELQLTTEMKAFIGRSNQAGQSGRLKNAVIDDIDIYYGTRDMLSKIGYISTERPTNYQFGFEDIQGNRLSHDKMAISLIGNPVLIDGKIGKALKLNGNNQCADFGDQRSDCFGNLDKCPLGALYSMWIRPDRLRDGMYFMSTGDNGIGLYFRGQRFHTVARTSAEQWEASSSNIETNKWYFVEVSFHPIHGLSLYIDNKLVAEDLKSSPRTDPPSRSNEANRFYIGRGKMGSADEKYADATFDEMEMWYSDRDHLTAHGYIQRNRPQSFIIDFEDLIDEEKLMHPVLSIRLVGKPVLVPGKVNNALELRDRGQYADLGRRGGECFSNLAECTHGLTIAAWMRFHRFENNMVFLSTGENGILMMYKDGYIQVKANGKGGITTPRFQSGQWYFIEITWHPDTGLKLYIDNELRGESGKIEITSHGQGSFYIGRPNQGNIPTGRYSTGNFDIDEMEIWYGSRENLLAFSYINRDNLGYEAFSMDTANGRRIEHTKYTIMLINGASIVPGRFGNAVMLNGRNQYVDMGTHFDSCFGNLDLCIHGLTLSFWLNPRQLSDGQTFLSAPTYSIYYEDGQLHSLFQGKNKTWTTSTTRMKADEWQRITMAWHPKKGLTMYVNDEFVDQDRLGDNVPQRGKPVSEHIYIGRSLASDSVTANLLADEMQVWYDDLDQLRATGKYRVHVVPQSINFDDFENNVLRLRDREIRGHGNIQMVQGRGQNSRAVYLMGNTGYLDLGANFTCGGDLENCKQGVTLRLGLQPRNLQDDMVFFDSFPIRLFYKNGRLHGQLQTSKQIWTVDTPDFRPGQWQRVELTWHPREGLVMYLDGRRVDYQTYPVEQASQTASDWRTYFGRSLQGGKTYADTAVDSIDFWPAYKNDIPEDGYLKVEPYATPSPVTTHPDTSNKDNKNGDTATIQNDSRNTKRPEAKEVKLIQFTGVSYVQFNLQNLPNEYLQPAEIEEFQFYFVSKQPNGLIWLHEDNNRKMYLALKDGKLVFVNDEGTRLPDKVVIGKTSGVRYDDDKWHLFKISRTGRKITLSVDEQNKEDYTFPNNVQFLATGEVYLGGTENTQASTGDSTISNFIGGLAQILYRTETKQGNRHFINEANLITELGDNNNNPGVIIRVVDWPLGTIPVTRQPPVVSTTTPSPRLTSVTIKDESVNLPVQDQFQLLPGSSISFNFQTIKRDALLMYAPSRTADKKFLALEIHDGKFYFTYNLGGNSKRVLISETEVSDGQSHEVDLRFSKDLMSLHLDADARRMRLEPTEELPHNLGPLNFGGVPSYQNLPWHTWARNGYQGCLGDLQINGRAIDLHQFVQTQRLFRQVDQQCTSMPQQCSQSVTCNTGTCINRWGGHYCDCRHTDYSGDQCQNPAWTGVFNGSTSYRMMFRPQKRYHVSDISYRFKTMARDGLIFQTKARNDNGFIRAELEGGRVKLSTNLGGRNQTFYTGNNLNDMQWHTVYVQKRGNEVFFWVDDLDQEKKILPGEGYYLNVDDVIVGGYNKDDLDIPPSTKNFVGYLRNIQIGDSDILQQIGDKGDGVFYKEPNIPPIIFGDVTFSNYNVHAVLPALGSTSDLSLYFMFKTNDPNGVILFSEGRNREMFAVELFGGRLHLKFSIPQRPMLHIATPEGINFNNGQWHTVFILNEKVNEQEQLSMSVDDLHLSYSYSGIDQLNLQGPLYTGGMPDEIFQRPYVKEFLSSKTGYRGCLASLNIGSNHPDLFEYGKNSGILDTCQDIRSQCTKLTCKNEGICHDHHNNGTTWCDCSKTAFAGPACEDEPLGYYFRSEGNQSLYGMLSYNYPSLEMNDNEVDEIVMGVMTDEKNAVLAKLISRTFKDFIEIKLVNGFPVVTYDTNGQGGSTTITSDVPVSDGKYHVIKVLRTRTKGTLYVDDRTSVNTHIVPHDVFNQPTKVFVGGVFQGGKIVDGTGFRGIIGGLYVNGQLIFPFVKDNVRTDFTQDVAEAPHPYKLGPLKPPSTTPRWVLDTTRTPVIVTMPPSGVIPNLPSDIGGGGIAWEPAAGSGGTGGSAGGNGGVSVWLFPDIGAGSSGLVPAGRPIGEEISPLSAGYISVVPSMPASGPRAGAVMGTILGLAVLASSLMWAFYRCKPGYCGCIKPPADVNISAPYAGGHVTVAGSEAKVDLSTMGDYIDSGVAVGGGKPTIVNSQGKVELQTNTHSAYYNAQALPSATNQHSSSFDSSNHRTDTLTTKGSTLGTIKSGRQQLYSSSGSGFDSGPVLTPASIQSYHFEGEHSLDPDYDLAIGVHHPNYQGNTLSVGAGAGAGGGFSTSTMSSSVYNYSVKTIRTVGGQRQNLGYASGSTSNVIVTPGAMGEEIRVDCCLMTTDGHSVVTGSSLGPPQVWNMSNGELLRIMQGETVGSTNLHFMCNDRLLVGAVNADLEINQYSVPKGVHNYVFQIWDYATGRPMGMTELETCSALTTMSDNDKVVFGRSDKFGGGTNIVVWDLIGNQPMKEMRYDAPVGNNDYVNYLSLSQNDRYVISGFTNTFDNCAEFVIFDMTLTSYNIADPSILRLDASPECTAILPRDEAVTGLRNGDLVVWSLKTGQPSRQLFANSGKHAHSREVKAVTRSEDNQFLVSASADGTLKLWDLESERNLCTMSGHTDEVWCATISADNEIVVSGSRDGTIRLWQLQSGREICSFNAGVDVFYITMSHDKETIVALGDKYGARKLIMLQVMRKKVKRQVVA